ncbi:MAG: nucleotidyltransferase family protein [Candidatus Thorarchaeota archaeon]
MTIAIETPSKEALSKLCRSHHIRRLSIFGSALREDFGPESDIDILVEFELGHVPGFFGLIHIQDELSELFGHKVDLRTPMDLSRYFREKVLREAEVQYVAR